MARGKDWKKRLLRRKARIGWWLANAGTRCKARLSSQQGPSWGQGLRATARNLN